MQIAPSKLGNAGANRGQTGAPTLITSAITRPLLDVRELWAYREVLYALIRREIQIRYAQTIAGAGWVILQPLLTERYEPGIPEKTAGSLTQGKIACQ